MKSSYTNKDLNYGDLLSSICFSIKPKKILEFGILEGYSLKKFVDNCDKNTLIESYDLFDEFEGNGSKDSVINNFKKHTNVSINYGDFYKKYSEIEDNSYDLIHIDIANDGDVYKFALENYRQKLTAKGLLILEGGSKIRDEVHWMKKYKKSSIVKFLNTVNNYKVIGEFPSLTIFHK
jgi:predicted O-methyltransferase YrrM